MNFYNSFNEMFIANANSSSVQINNGCPRSVRTYTPNSPDVLWFGPDTQNPYDLYVGHIYARDSKDYQRAVEDGFMDDESDNYVFSIFVLDPDERTVALQLLEEQKDNPNLTFKDISRILIDYNGEKIFFRRKR